MKHIFLLITIFIGSTYAYQEHDTENNEDENHKYHKSHRNSFDIRSVKVYPSGYALYRIKPLIQNNTNETAMVPMYKDAPLRNYHNYLKDLINHIGCFNWQRDLYDLLDTTPSTGDKKVAIGESINDYCGKKRKDCIKELSVKFKYSYSSFKASHIIFRFIRKNNTIDIPLYFPIISENSEFELVNIIYQRIQSILTTIYYCTGAGFTKLKSHRKSI